jgi:hypothetical protein
LIRSRINHFTCMQVIIRISVFWMNPAAAYCSFSNKFQSCNIHCIKFSAQLPSTECTESILLPQELLKSSKFKGSSGLLLHGPLRQETQITSHNIFPMSDSFQTFSFPESYTNHLSYSRLPFVAHRSVPIRSSTIILHAVAAEGRPASLLISRTIQITSFPDGHQRHISDIPLFPRPWSFRGVLLGHFRSCDLSDTFGPIGGWFGGL